MRILILLLTSLVLFSCSSGGKKQFQKLYYRFPEPQSIETPLPLTIKKPTALGIFANRPLVAVDSSGALKQMNYSFWLESPKVLFKNYLNSLFKQNESINEESYTLITHILKFEKQQDLAKVKINFKLISPEGTVTLDKIYEEQLQANDKSVGQFVKNIGKLLEKISQELAKDIQ
jgi:ABC-type uncharacterized transport system auxiliary subunit